MLCVETKVQYKLQFLLRAKIYNKNEELKIKTDTKQWFLVEYFKQNSNMEFLSDKTKHKIDSKYKIHWGNHVSTFWNVSVLILKSVNYYSTYEKEKKG